MLYSIPSMHPKTVVVTMHPNDDRLAPLHAVARLRTGFAAFGMKSRWSGAHGIHESCCSTLPPGPPSRFSLDCPGCFTLEPERGVDMTSDSVGAGRRRHIVRVAHAVVAAVAAAIVLGAAPSIATPGEQSTAAQERLAVLRDITNEASFRTAFDSAAKTPRLVLLLSPT